MNSGKFLVNFDKFLVNFGKFLVNFVLQSFYNGGPKVPKGGGPTYGVHK